VETALVRRGQERGELVERLHDVLERAVDLEVVLLDVVDEPDGRPVVVEAAVELARLGHQDAGLAALRAARDAVGAGAAAAADLRAGGADDEAGVQAARDEHVRQHRGGRALAVRSGDADAGAALLHEAERLRVADHLDAARLRLQELGMVGLDGRARDHEVAGRGHLRAVVADRHPDAHRLERVGRVARGHVAPRDRRAARAQHLREAAHAAAADSHQPDAAALEVGHVHLGELRSGALEEGAHVAVLAVLCRCARRAPGSARRREGEVDVAHDHDIGRRREKSAPFSSQRRSFGTLGPGAGWPFVQFGPDAWPRARTSTPRS
jgi:hypothetical protein